MRNSTLPRLCLSLVFLFAAAVVAADELAKIAPPPAELKAPAFYTKFISAHGYPIVASDKVSDYALREAAFLVDQMLHHRPDVRDAMIASGSRLCIIAHNEFTTDLPEFEKLGLPREFPTLTAKDFWDARARGTGGSQTDPYCSCGEENLLGYDGDPYGTENILIHEFAHNIHLRGMLKVDPEFDTRVKLAYERAMADGLWKGKYASVNHHEYFAEGVQSWFDNNRQPDHDHNHVDTRAELLEYDAGLAALCREVFGATEIKYTKPATRLRGHMAGYDPATAPKFVWPERLKLAQAEIRKQAEQRSQKAAKPPKAANLDPARWEKEIAAMEAADQKFPPPEGAVLFIGSSSIRLWKTLAEDFPDHKVINRGFGGSCIADSTHFLERLVIPFKPRVIVLGAGSNDLAAGKTPEKVLADFQAFVEKIERTLPEARIVVFSMNPTPARWKQADRQLKTNSLLQEFIAKSSGNGKKSKLSYVDIWTPLLDKEGQPRLDLHIADRLHPNVEGYRLRTEALRPYLQE